MGDEWILVNRTSGPVEFYPFGYMYTIVIPPNSSIRVKNIEEPGKVDYYRQLAPAGLLLQRISKESEPLETEKPKKTEDLNSLLLNTIPEVKKR